MKASGGGVPKDKNKKKTKKKGVFASGRF